VFGCLRIYLVARQPVALVNAETCFSESCVSV
jgi:hypothetical protein